MNPDAPADSSESVDQAIEAFERALTGRPGAARALAGLAELAVRKGRTLQAYKLTRKALLADAGDEVGDRMRALLSSLVSPYHVAMMNDERRNAAWNSAITRAVRPGARVLEIGTGAGMLALMAARAGAARVTTCEQKPVLAAVAREIAAANGYSAVIDVIPKGSRDLQPGDLEAPADLLFCDIFADNLLDFDPLPALADARRLLKTGAPVIPAAGAIRIAAGAFSDYARTAHVSRAAGFDLTPFAPFVRSAFSVNIGDPRITLRSEPAEIFRFDFAAPSHPPEGRTETELELTETGEINGIFQWIRLELDSETWLEARPEPGAVFFSSPVFYPLRTPRTMERGDKLRVSAGWKGSTLSVRAEN